MLLIFFAIGLYVSWSLNRCFQPGLPRFEVISCKFVFFEPICDLNNNYSTEGSSYQQAMIVERGRQLVFPDVFCGMHVDICNKKLSERFA